MSLEKCLFCGSSNIEKVSDYEQTCTDCGFGYGKGVTNDQSMKLHFNFLEKAISLAKLSFPNDTPKQLEDKIAFHLHRKEGHPTNKDGYCEYCQINWEGLTDQDFKDKLGYTKSYWYGDKNKT